MVRQRRRRSGYRCLKQPTRDRNAEVQAIAGRTLAASDHAGPHSHSDGSLGPGLAVGSVEVPKNSFITYST